MKNRQKINQYISILKTGYHPWEEDWWKRIIYRIPGTRRVRGHISANSWPVWPAKKRVSWHVWTTFSKVGKSCFVNNIRRVKWRHEHLYRFDTDIYINLTAISSFVHDTGTWVENGSFTEFPGPVGWLKNLGWEDTFRQIHDRCDRQKKTRVSWHVYLLIAYIK
jgi:hypothetical protein